MYCGKLAMAEAVIVLVYVYFRWNVLLEHLLLFVI